MGDSSGDIDKLAHVRFARRSKYLLSSTRLSLAVPSLASGRMAQPAVVSTDTVSCPIDLSTDSTLLATHRLYLSLENSLALQLYTPEPPKELVARYVETDPIVSEVVGKLPSSKDSAANLSISLSASEADDEEEAEDISPATTASGSPRIIELDESGDQGADGQEQHQREPATETDALLGEGASRSARTERQQQEQSTGGGVFKTLWRTIKNIFTMLIYLTATVVLLYVAAEYFEMQSPPPLPERGVQQQQQLVTPVLLPSEPAAMQPPTSLFSESTSAAPPLDMTLLMAGGDEVTTTATMHQSGGPKVRVRSKARRSTGSSVTGFHH
ncbi:hypothetical protein FBU59_001370 [Linderina macrospora]|uniref:Uncharacterized protein n=1 Tax=Linderina macrospora TaxID=4868 RepID=A0ACC1JE82_9FUNG|nr:hypothetical protein FBU59_001370 [Linderina macrospora]